MCTWHLYKSFHVAAQLWMKKRHDAENRFCIEKNYMHFIVHSLIRGFFLYKVALPELKISPILYFVIHNSVVLSKILKIIVPFWLLFTYFDYYQNNQFYGVKIDFLNNFIFNFALMAQRFSIFWITPLVDDKIH